MDLLYTTSCITKSTTNPAAERVQALAHISRSAIYAFALYKAVSSHTCVFGNGTRAPIVNPPNNAHLEASIPFPPSYIRVHAVAWKCGDGQSQRHTDGPGQCTFRLRYSSRETKQVEFVLNSVNPVNPRPANCFLRCVCGPSFVCQ